MTFLCFRISKYFDCYTNDFI